MDAKKMEEMGRELLEAGYDSFEAGRHMAQVTRDTTEKGEGERVARLYRYLDDLDTLQRRVKNHPYRVRKTPYE